MRINLTKLNLVYHGALNRLSKVMGKGILMLQKARLLKEKFVRYLRYDYRLTFWLNLNRWRRLVAFLSRHFDVIRRITFVLIALGISYLVNHFGETHFTQEILSNYLVAVGAMTGGTIAIVFTISIFLLQSVSDLYSSQYFEVYIHDLKEKFVYFIVIIITVILLGGGLYVGGLETVSEKVSKLIIFSSLFLVSLVFALIDWQYKLVRQKINPSEAISFLEKEGVRFLEKLQYDAEKMAGILQAKDGTVSNGIALAASYNFFLQPFVKNLNRQLENLVEISMKLSDKQEIETTKRGFTAVHNIIAKFFEARKTSSMAIPSNDAFLAMESDSQGFLTSNFERINNAAEKFIREGKDGNAAYIIDIYGSLAKKAKEIEFVGGRGIENPTFDHVAGYLNSLVKSGQRSKNLEVVFQGSRVSGDVALIAAESGLQISLRSIQDNIREIAIYGLTEKQFIIIDNCTSAYLKIINSVFLSKKIVRDFDFSLRKISEVTAYTWASMKLGYLPDNFTSRVSLSKGYDQMYSLIVGVVNHYFELTDEREKERYKDDLVELLKNINSNLRRLSEEIKNCDSTLVGSIGRLIFNINNLIVDLLTKDELKNHFEDEEDDLLSHLGWNIHLPFWFVHHAEKFDGGSNSYYDLIDSVAKTGILAIEKLEDKSAALECVKSLYSITKECLKKTESGYGFDEPRTLEKACYLGILALKKGWIDVFMEVAFNIYDFEPKYFAKYLTNLPAGIDPENHNVSGLPHKDQLSRELSNWRDDFNREKWNGVHLMDSAQDRMYELIERIDIDRFIYEVWGWFPSGSEVEEEISLKFARRGFIGAIKRIAKVSGQKK